MESLRNELREFVIDNFLFGEEELDNGASFLEGGIIDSTGVLELVGFLEERYALEVADHELIPANLDSVDALTAFVTAKVASNASLLEGSRR